jgi:hypothetical protein
MIHITFQENMATAETRFKAVIDKIQEDTKRSYILLDENILKDGITVAVDNINQNYVLSLNHLLMPTKLHENSLKVLQKLEKTKAEYFYGDTYLGNLIFSSVMQPEMRKCVTALKKEEHGKALTSLMGIFFVFANHEGWIRDNECWMEKSFSKFFWEYSLCWKIVLGKLVVLQMRQVWFTKVDCLMVTKTNCFNCSSINKMKSTMLLQILMTILMKARVTCAQVLTSSPYQRFPSLLIAFLVENL